MVSMGIGRTGVLVYIDENGERVVVSADKPLPSTVNGEPVKVFVSEIVEK